MDDIDELLTPPDIGHCHAEADSWKAMTCVLRRRRWWRRGRVVALMSLCFCAGAFVMHRPTAHTTETTFAFIDSEPSPTAEPIPVADDTPRRLERKAMSAQGERQRVLFRRAGDGFLNYGDEVAAVRCYRKALTGGSPPELVIHSNDSWLLTSLKISLNKE